MRVRNMTNPRVTVLIDTYNHERFIEQALVSVFEQDFPAADMEVLVVDDGSTDRTPEIVRKFEPRARLLRKPNGGQASAFNAGIPEARGEIVAFLDGDDWWARNKLTHVTETMAADPGVGIVGHGIVMVQQDGRELSEILREGFRFGASSAEGALLFRLRKSLLGTSRMTIRRELLQRIGPVPESLVIQADEYLFTLAATLAEGQILPHALTYYRFHDANGYQLGQADPGRLRRKQEVLAALAESLSAQLDLYGIHPQARRLIIECVQMERDQIRLVLDGGWPWETVKTERKVYEVLHPDAPLAHRVFKMVTLLPAAAMPPRFYYGLRQKLTKSDFYLRARKRWLPMPELPHVERS